MGGCNFSFGTPMSIVGGNALSSLQANKERPEWLPPGFFFQNLPIKFYKSS